MREVQSDAGENGLQVFHRPSGLIFDRLRKASPAGIDSSLTGEEDKAIGLNRG